MTVLQKDRVLTEITSADMLGRQPFVDRLLSITETLADNRKNACYAIDGKWGIGKTFVLSMFEEQAKSFRISEENALGKYIIFKYNCWEYDYYEEPLVAITASMLDDINENTEMIPQGVRDRLVGVLKVVGEGLLHKATQVVEEKTGISVSEVATVLLTGKGEGEREAEKEFDQYSALRTNITKIQREIAEIAKEQTVIILVDELDRCLPEYMIKVLERLHHLFDGLKNVQVILSIDKSQLEHTVSQVYGSGTDVGEYLKKFIDFGVELDTGTIDAEVFDQRFNKYVGLFDGFAKGTTDKDVTDFKKTILEGIDIRNRIALVDKCNLIHDLVAKGEKKDFRFLCLELFLAVIDFNKIDIDYANRMFRIGKLFEPNQLFKDCKDNPRFVTMGLTKLSEQYKAGCYPDGNHPIVQKRSFGGHSIEFDSLLGALLSIYRAILGIQDDVLYSMAFKEIEKRAFVDYGKRFWEYLNIIR